MADANSWTNITYEVRDQVATITMNTPENLNLLSMAMIREVDQAMLAADADNEVRVIIFTGAGRAFSAGHDLSGKTKEAPPPGSPREGSVEARLDFEQEYYYDANLRIRNLKKPTI